MSTAQPGAQAVGIEQQNGMTRRAFVRFLVDSAMFSTVAYAGLGMLAFFRNPENRPPPPNLEVRVFNEDILRAVHARNRDSRLDIPLFPLAAGYSTALWWRGEQKIKERLPLRIGVAAATVAAHGIDI